ncbi:hypothetical protein C8250_028995 [Streptomyces sp. So13.3]|uniref:hypothetical protein n=1 Tax=Streptomyces sp. So13.3 TaxID=2136173 RepID=UPI001106CA5B|nr:hypothetical protein [Streptomyces sp. So13.3]QNA75390.1 hypothetical protein C8250_028995 [Streptomyces sp. So13.3]
MEDIGGTAKLCDWCGRIWDEGGAVGLVLDSSAVHARDPSKDGKRLVIGCSAAHLAALQEEYRQRPFIDEELWAWQIARALITAPQDTTLDQLADTTGLRAAEIQQAMSWHRTQGQPDSHQPDDGAR